MEKKYVWWRPESDNNRREEPSLFEVKTVGKIVTVIEHFYLWWAKMLKMSDLFIHLANFTECLTGANNCAECWRYNHK